MIRLTIVTWHCWTTQVVHPAPGNFSGTLVNGILHHCSLPTASLSNIEEDVSDDDDDVDETSSVMSEMSVRPGIVHRLDKGTSGLLVVAKVMIIQSCWELVIFPNTYFLSSSWKFAGWTCSFSSFCTIQRTQYKESLHQSYLWSSITSFWTHWNSSRPRCEESNTYGCHSRIHWRQKCTPCC